MEKIIMENGQNHLEKWAKGIWKMGKIKLERGKIQIWKLAKSTWNICKIECQNWQTLLGKTNWNTGQNYWDTGQNQFRNGQHRVKKICKWSKSATNMIKVGKFGMINKLDNRQHVIE
jgi:hypothetical protein